MEPIYSKEKKCLVAIGQAMQILDGKWSFLVLSQLLFNGTQRFNQLRRNLNSISTKSLTDTLRHLEQNDIVHRQIYPTVPVTVEYSLTEKGRAFQTVLIEMGNWGEDWIPKAD